MFDQRKYESMGLFCLRWTARISSLMTVSILFFFVIGEEIDLNMIGLKEIFGFLFFPIGLVIGQLISWRNEGVGGVISAFSLFAFYFFYGLILNGRFWQGWSFILFTIPSFLFLVYWLFSPKELTKFRHI